MSIFLDIYNPPTNYRSITFISDDLCRIGMIDQGVPCGFNTLPTYGGLGTCSASGSTGGSMDCWWFIDGLFGG